ncbi:MAG TPA: hypothetical protein VL251_04440 [Thermomonas sp.]|nr:hypothetical protein [Thermomonas sp.]
MSMGGGARLRRPIPCIVGSQAHRAFAACARIHPVQDHHRTA